MLKFIIHPSSIMHTGCPKLIKVLLASFLLILLNNITYAQPATYCDGLPGDWPTALTFAGPLGTHIIDKANVSDGSDNQFTGGSQDPDLLSELTWNFGNVNDKTDITNAGAILDGCYLRFFGDRTADNGDAAIGFWFYKDPSVSLNPDGSFSGVHMNGDLLIVSHFTGGGGTATPIVYVWENGSLREIEGVTGCSKTNTTRVASPWAYQSKFDVANYYPVGTFFEGYVNICDLEGVDACFTNFLLETRNSQAINASLQDLVFGKFNTKPTVTMAGQTVCEGGTATFTANVTGGLAPITYSFNGGEFTTDNTFQVPNATSNQTITVVAKGANGCESLPIGASLTVTDKPDVTANNATICEGGSIDLSTLISDADGGTISFHLSQAAADAGTGALDPTTVSPTAASTTYYVRSTVTVNSVVCYGTTTLTVNVVACSKIELTKQTNGAIDPTKTWTFTLSGGGLNLTQSVENDADGILFDGVTLSRNQTYTICETNVAAGYKVTIQYWDSDSWENVPVYDPNVIDGGGDFNQGEAVGNYCFKVGVGGIALPPNTYGSETVVSLRLLINNIPPPGGTARTPGYWKNWNTCSKGNQAATAAKNGGSANGFWLLDNHLPLTMWTSTNTACPSFVITSCQQAVYILDERQNGGKYAKMSSDAAYKLAKHLLAYQLNIKSGSAPCAATEAAAISAQALLAKYCFNGTGSSYLSSKEKTAVKRADYTAALQYAKILDAYNNNLPCPGVVLLSTSKLAMNNTNDIAPVTELKVSASPNPFYDKVRFVIESPVSGHGNLEVYNLLGQKVKTVYEGHINAGKGQVIEFNVPQTLRSNLIYMMRIGNHRATGKLIRLQR